MYNIYYIQELTADDGCFEVYYKRKSPILPVGSLIAWSAPETWFDDRLYQQIESYTQIENGNILCRLEHYDAQGTKEELISDLESCGWTTDDSIFENPRPRRYLDLEIKERDERNTKILESVLDGVKYSELADKYEVSLTTIAATVGKKLRKIQRNSGKKWEDYGFPEDYYPHTATQVYKDLDALKVFYSEVK